MGSNHNLHWFHSVGCMVYSYGDAMIIGTIRHKPYGVTASLNCDLPSTLATRSYACGLEQPNYPLPAIPVKVTWGGVFWRWLTIVQCLAPHYRVVRYWEENPNGFKEYR